MYGPGGETSKEQDTILIQFQRCWVLTGRNPSVFSVLLVTQIYWTFHEFDCETKICFFCFINVAFSHTSIYTNIAALNSSKVSRVSMLG